MDERAKQPEVDRKKANRKRWNRKYYLANSEKWKEYRQKAIKRNVETALRIIRERGEPRDDNGDHIET